MNEENENISEVIRTRKVQIIIRVNKIFETF